MIPKSIRPQAIFLKLLMQISKHKVIDGPFENQLCGFKSFGSAYFPKILGTYEMEIYQHLINFLDKKPSVIIDAGAAEGFYAVACAKHCSNSIVYALETNSNALDLLEKNIILNFCKNIKIMGKCDKHSLKNILCDQGGFVLMDIEGAENECLDPFQIPSLRFTDILVETHDYFYPGTTKKIKERFKISHNIEEITGKERDVTEFPFHKLPTYIKFIPKKYIRYSLLEHRPIQSTWLAMTPKPNYKIN